MLRGQIENSISQSHDLDHAKLLHLEISMRLMMTDNQYFYAN